MPAPNLQYGIYGPVTRELRGRLDVREPAWAETVNGGTTFTGKVTVPDNSISIAQIKALTEPDRNALYVEAPDAYAIPWGGPIVARSFDEETNTLSITGMDWRSWLYQVIMGPAPSGTSTNTFSFTNVDQFALARTILARLTMDGTLSQGVPSIQPGNTLLLSGVLRNYQISGLDFRSYGAYLDDLANMDRGFEWDVLPYYHTDGLPILRLQLYFPQQGATIPGLRFSKGPSGGNILTSGDSSEDGTAVARRIWAVGEGPNAESTPWAVDNDPVLLLGGTLRKDIATTYQGALTRANLASYARAERIARTDALAALTFKTRMDNPSIFSYAKGDRCQITIKNRWQDVNVSNCRIISRGMNPDENTVELTVNLNDVALPEVDTGGSV